MGKTSSNLVLYLCLALGVLVLSSAAILIRLAHAPGIVTSFYRTGIAATCLAPVFIWQSRRQTTHLTWQGISLAVLGGAFFASDMALWSSGIVLSGATIPTLMANTAPLWVGLGSYLLFKEKQTGRFWVGLSIAMSGAMIVLGQDLSLALNFGMGSLLGLTAAIFYGAYFLVTQRGRSHLDTLAYFWISTSVCALLLLLLMLLFHMPLTGYDRVTWLSFLAAGLLVQLVGWLVLNFVQGHLPAAIVSPTLLLQPVLTAFLAILIFTEKFTPWHILGGGAVLAGVFLVHHSRFSTVAEEEQALPSSTANVSKGKIP